MSDMVTTDGGPKRLRLLEPQGEPDIIECDGREYVPLDGSNWARLFGTPERAVNTIMDFCDSIGQIQTCAHCPLFGAEECMNAGKAALYLRGRWCE